MSPTRPIGVVALSLAAVAALVAPAGALAAERALRADGVAARPCTTLQSPGAPGTARATARAGGVALVTARLSAPGWELAVFEGSGRLVAASLHGAGEQVAQGFATAAGELAVQACRGPGAPRRAELDVRVGELAGVVPEGRLRLVRVLTDGPGDAERLASAGLDLTEHGGPGFVDVALHSPEDGRHLRALGFPYEVLEADLAARALADRRAELRAAARGGSGEARLPSGRVGTYRRLFEYSAELRALAEQRPRLVRYFTLPHETFEGRVIEGIEIAPRVRRRDGRPAFLMPGAHHAREWPSAEHTMEFAYELVRGWAQRRKPVRRLLRRARVILVPVANPDGFNLSREAGEALGAAGGRGGLEETVNLLIPFEYHRKNCRYTPPLEADGGSCDQLLSTGLAQFGVDINRNYGGFWGGPGASAPDSLPLGALAQDYRGPGPFSEPESQAIRWLVSREQVVTLITNHTFSNLVLRPPGLEEQGPARDERLLRRLGDAMAAENGYTSQRAYELYDTTGTTEDWSYYATGGLGYTFEIGPAHFHPPFAEGVVAEYLGLTGAAGPGGGNRAAYLKALRSTANPRRHAVIAGRAPRGSVLRLRKSFLTATSPVQDGAGNAGDVITFRDRLQDRLRVGRDGRFTWHVNPSTRPIADRPERWRLTCHARPGGPALASRRVLVARGERVRVDLRRACRR
jgi:hypothetical protein